MSPLTLQSLGMVLIFAGLVFLLLTAWRDRNLEADGELALALVALSLALFLLARQ